MTITDAEVTAAFYKWMAANQMMRDLRLFPTMSEEDKNQVLIQEEKALAEYERLYNLRMEQISNE